MAPPASSKRWISPTEQGSVSAGHAIAPPRVPQILESD
jgi:hypothetical protein